MEKPSEWTLPASPPTAPPAHPPTGWPEQASASASKPSPQQPGSTHKRVTRTVAIGALGLGLALGGFTVANAASSTTTTPSTTNPSTGAATAPHSNEDPTHETGESAEREAAEAAGKVGGPGDHLGHGPNEDPAHEANETPEREAQEDAAKSGASTDSNRDTPDTTTAPTTSVPGL